MSRLASISLLIVLLAASTARAQTDAGDLFPKVKASLNDDPSANPDPNPSAIPAGATVVDLLKLVDAARDAVNGNWELRAGTLVSDANDTAKIELSYQPPVEYDYKVVFSRTGAKDALTLVCWAAGHQFEFQCGAAFNTVAGFGLISDKNVHVNQTTRHSNAWLENGRRYTCIIKVRKNGVQAYLDGRLVTEWKTDYSDMSMHQEWQLRRRDTIGIETQQSPTVFYSIDVIEITGKGSRRAAVPARDQNQAAVPANQVNGNPANATADQTSSGQPPPPDRLPMPPAAALQAATQLVNEVYKNDLAKSGTPQHQKESVQKLLQAGLETNNDPAGRYVLLAKARETAIRAGDAAAAFAAEDKIDYFYQTDAQTAGLDTAAAYLKGVRPKDELSLVVERLNVLSDQALAADRYDIAIRDSDLMLETARRINEPALIAQASQRAADIHTYASAFESLKSSLTTLARNASDPDANLAIGRFRCFYKGNWNAGLPLLALGSDATLKALATKEIAPATGTEDQVKLGNAWWDLAEKEGDIAKWQIRRHAAEWYRLAGPNLEGIRKVVVHKRLQQVEQHGGSVRVFLADLHEQEVQTDNNTFSKNTGRKVAGVAALHDIYLPPCPNGPSHVAYDLSQQKFTTLQATVALDDGVGNHRAQRNAASLVFRVVGDGKELWRSSTPIVRGGQSEAFRVDISGVQKLELFIDNGGDSYWGWALWVDPVLIGIGKFETRLNGNASPSADVSGPSNESWAITSSRVLKMNSCYVKTKPLAWELKPAK